MSDDKKDSASSKKRPQEPPAERPRPQPRLANPGRLENRYESLTGERRASTRRPVRRITSDNSKSDND